MRLNTLSPAPGSRPDKVRKGRGSGSGLGKTCGRGHKGQKSRSGGKPPVGFEGGQMPLYRRIPKFGFISRLSNKTAEIRLSDLDKLKEDVITVETLAVNNLLKHNTLKVKVFASGDITRAITLKGIPATAGAAELITKAGGKIEA